MMLIDSFKFGAGYTSSPTDFAGLQRWYKADAIVGLANNDPITSWPDSSPSNDPLVTISGGTEPIYKTNYYGALPSAENGKLKMTNLALTDAVTILMVGNATSDCLLFGHSTKNTQIRMHRAAADILSFYANGGAETLSDELPGADTDTRMLVWRRLDVATGTLTFRKNKTAVAVVAGGNSFLTLDIEEFGHNPNAPFTAFVGHVGEICVWNTLLSTGDLDTLYDGYFQIKYGL